MSTKKISSIDLIANPEIREGIKRIIKYEEEQLRKFRENPVYQGMEDLEPFWEIMDIPIEWQIVRKLLFAGIVKKMSRRDYQLIDREKIKKEIEEFEKIQEMPEVQIEKVSKIPNDLFDVIVSYDDIKNIFLKSIKADNPVSILLVGPPATAKSLFLMEIERLQGSVMTTGSSSTKAGIKDVLLERKPRFLLIDEIEKITDSRDLSVLLTLMESHRLLITMHNQQVDMPLKCWVFAAANSTTRMPQELLSRFLIFNLKPYSDDDFLKVAKNVLVKREGKNSEISEYIANQVLNRLHSKDIRDCIKVARLSEDKETVDFIIKTMLKYK